MIKAPAQRSQSAITVLDCGCTRIFSPVPRKADTVYCTLHGAAKVLQAALEWQLKCAQCRYSRKFGAAQVTAEAMAAKHASKRRHKVNIFYGRKYRGSFGGQHLAQLDFSSLDPPPF